MASSKKRGRPETIVERLRGAVERELPAQARSAFDMTLGLSGGVDSVVLLDILRALARQWPLRLSALHVNHGLSPNAAKWERFCRAHCRSRRVALRCERVDVAGAGANVEAAARAARYAAFERHAGRYLVLAHNRDDQAETVLLQLLRGAGARGLSAMPAARALAALGPGARSGEDAARILLRPLLGVSRAEIEDYARARRLRWVEDESNVEDRFARNFLRARVLPALEQRFPGCRAALARSSAHLGAASALLDDLARIDLRAATRSRRLQAAALAGLGAARAANALRYLLRSRGLPTPSTRRLEEMIAQLCDARSDAEPRLDLGDTMLRRYRGAIELVPVSKVDRGASCLRWQGESRLVLPGDGELRARPTRGKGLSLAQLQQGVVTVRLRSGGERMRIDPARPRRTLKNLLQEAGVPPWQRERLPLIYLDEQLVWAPRVGTACELRAAPGERAVLFSWIVPGPAAL